jgi:hypothetical protein
MSCLWGLPQGGVQNHFYLLDPFSHTDIIKKVKVIAGVL